MSFEILEHTADLGILAKGKTPADTLEALCQGFTAVATDENPLPEATQPLEFEVSAADWPGAIVKTLGEVLWALEDEDLLWVGGSLDVHEHEGRIQIQGRGQGVRMHEHEGLDAGVEIKAITYHELLWEQTSEGYQARVYLDI